MKRWTCALATALAVALVVSLVWAPVTVAQQKTETKTTETKGDGKRGLTFEIYKDAKEEYRWRLKAANGQIIATSGQGYKAKADCRHGIELIQEGAAKAKVEEVSGK
jgi:uncharacterized protein YegP (UPF0339 family)